MIDWVTQSLTTAPLWIQTPIVFAVVVPMCAVLAAILIRGLNLGNRLIQRLRSARRIGEVESSH